MSTQSSEEIEIKFQATEQTPVPTLSSLGAVQSTAIHQLHATYYDTEDLRLFRSKITLRHRVGGKDDGWHIKFPGIEHRLELQAPDSPWPSDDFFEPIRALIRDRELVPIATVDNERHETVLECGEFVDDHVTAVSLLRHGKKSTWREWEFEFHGNPEPGLRQSVLNVLRSTGASESPSPSKLKTALGSSVRYAPRPAVPVALDSALPLRNIFTTLNASYKQMIDMDPYMRGFGPTAPVADFAAAALTVRSCVALCAYVGESDFEASIREDVDRLTALLQALESRDYREFLQSYDYYAILDGVEAILGQRWQVGEAELRATVALLVDKVSPKAPTSRDVVRLSMIRTAALALPKGARAVRAASKAMEAAERYRHCAAAADSLRDLSGLSMMEAFERGRQYGYQERKLDKRRRDFVAALKKLKTRLS